MLTNEEKAGIINQHKRNIEMSKYNLELSLIEENALTVKNTETIASLNAQIADLTSKVAALDTELDSLNQQKQDKMSNKLELVVVALQQRIGEIVSNYETQIAMLRAELTEISNKDKAAQEYSDELVAKILDVEA